MKAAKITVAGTTYFLVMDGEAMFTIRDIYGGTRLMLEKMEQDTREGFLETCNAAAILAERGELVRLFGHELRAEKARLGRLVTLEAGKILSEGSIDKVKNDPKVIEVYLGH